VDAELFLITTMLFPSSEKLQKNQLIIGRLFLLDQYVYFPMKSTS
jgi:hypothetical protein